MVELRFVGSRGVEELTLNSFEFLDTFEGLGVVPLEEGGLVVAIVGAEVVGSVRGTNEARPEAVVVGEQASSTTWGAPRPQN